jgi:hypothetical protein
MIQYKNGNRFEGTFVNGIREGKGKMFYPDGSFYEGDFQNDKKEGHGVMDWITERVMS